MSEKMVRKQLLMPPSIVRRLERLADDRGVSVSEIVRQAINSFDANSADALGSEELMDLVSVRLREAFESTKRARAKVNKALRALDAAES
ncbi:MAG TPA: ribbon-helix-helix protein, CopG family [Gammaproteobacteria bacterium]|nr:ribbon-helix-helix protein, CopG family [Gammaproteobacteria bacterium]